MAKPRWDVRSSGTAIYGPFTAKQIRAGVKEGALDRRTKVRPAGSNEAWTAAIQVAALKEAMASAGGGGRVVSDHFLILFIGLPLLLGVAFCHIMEMRAARRAVRTEGQVVEIKRRSHGKDSTSTRYTPIIEFKAKDGRTYRIESKLSGDSESWHIGQKVTVSYDPDNPAGGWYASWSGWKVAKFSVLILAVTVLLLQVGVIIKRARRRRRWLEEMTETARKQAG